MKRIMFTFIGKQLQIFRSIILFIFNTIDGVSFAFMMDNFSWPKMPTNHFFYYKMRSEDMPSFIGKGMIGLKDIDIALTISRYTTLPIIMIFPRILREFFTQIPFIWKLFFIHPITFIRTKFSFARYSSKKFLMTSFTRMYYSFALPITCCLPNFITTLARVRTIYRRVFSIVMNIKFFFAMFTNNFNSLSYFSSHLITSKIKAAFSLQKKERLSSSDLLTANFRHKKSVLSFAMLIIAFILCLSIKSHSAEIITGFEEKDLPVLNEEFRKLDDKARDLDIWDITNTTEIKLKTPKDIDMQKQEIKNLVIENRTSDPTSPVEGQIWLRTDL